MPKKVLSKKKENVESKNPSYNSIKYCDMKGRTYLCPNEITVFTPTYTHVRSQK